MEVYTNLGIVSRAERAALNLCLPCSIGGNKKSGAAVGCAGLSVFSFRGLFPALLFFPLLEFRKGHHVV